MTRNEQKKAANDARLKLLQGLNAFEEATAPEDEIVLNTRLKRADTVPPAQPEKCRENPDGIVDILTFCEHPYFLNLKLTPWQRCIAKWFYAGTSGNLHLAFVDDTYPETEKSCTGCVWNYVKEGEEQHWASLKAAEKEGNSQFVKLPLMIEENAPCLDCSRFSDVIRKDRYAEIVEKAVSKKEKKEAEILTERENVDRFQNERMLLDDEGIPKNVREQIESKIGNKFEELILVLGRRSGKPISVETPVLTTRGWSTMGALQVGEQVYGPDGKPTKIIAKSEVITDEECYEIHFSNGEVIVAGENHEWNVFDKHRYNSWCDSDDAKGKVIPDQWWDWIPSSKSLCLDRHLISTLLSDYSNGLTIGEISEKYLVSVQECGSIIKEYSEIDPSRRGIYTTKELAEYKNNHPERSALSIPLTLSLEIPKNNLPIDPWCFGYLLGGGNTHGFGRVACATEDRAFVISKFTAAGFEINHDNTCDEQHFYIKGLRKKWKEMGLHLDKSIPDFYQMACEEDRLALLTGLIDSDGSVGAQGEYIFVNSTLALIEGVEFLATSLGFKVKRYNSHHPTKKQQWAVHIHATRAIASLERKLIKARHDWFFEQHSTYITKVVKMESRIPIQCVQVDNNMNCFLIGKSLITTKNSFMVSIIALYEVYRFLMMGHPQARYPIMEFDVITICNVAVNESQAKSAIFDKIKQLATTSPFFIGHIPAHKPPTQLEMYFLTDHDKEENKRREAIGQDPLDGTIQLMSGHSNSSGLVGRTMAVIIIDEMAEMASASAEGGTDSDLYSKMKPSIATFGRDGRIICISNPLGPHGKFFDLYNMALREDAETTLMFQLATWQANPNIEKSWLANQERADAKTFPIYYGARFGSSSAEPFIPPEYIQLAFDRGYGTQRVNEGHPLIKYYAHLDPAHSSDNYSLVVVHAEPSNKFGPDNQLKMRIVVDHMHFWKPQGKNHPIDSQEVEAYLLELATKFNLVQVSFDQWNSQQSIAKIRAHGVNAILTAFNKQYKDQIYGELYELFAKDLIDIYAADTMDLGECKEAKLQFDNLQKKWRGKMPRVEAADGFKDDFCDCIASASFQALKNKTFGRLARPSSFKAGWR